MKHSARRSEPRVEKLPEVFPELPKYPGSESPHIHRNHFVPREMGHRTGGIGVFGMRAVALNL